MNNRVRVKLSVLMISIALVVASTIHASQQQPQTEKPPAGQAPAAQPAQQQPQSETLQVLKGMPRQQIVQEMRKIAAGLGVECNFCHLVPGFQAETPRKAVARLMMRDYTMAM